MADPLRVDPELRIPPTNITLPSSNHPRGREKHMRLWDPDSDSGGREWDLDEPQDWWFASTAIPLLAATLGPLANVLSVAALVTTWRSCLIVDVQPGAAARACMWNGQGSTLGPQLKGQPFGDPPWAYSLNILSLVTGCVGNVFLLCNFTKRIRYIIALPATIVMWAASSAILIGITVAMHFYTPPIRPQQTYHQGFWYAVFAAVIYLICFVILMVNMLGHILGHYPQTFALRDSHRTLILQTMLFFIWLAAGGAVFSTIESNYGGGSFEWSFSNALYFCEVTILTVGFGDIYPTNNFSRGLMLPYAVGGIVMLGLVVSSLTTFATELGAVNIVRKHTEQNRHRTIGRTVTNSTEYLDRQSASPSGRPHISSPYNPIDTSAATRIGAEKTAASQHAANRSPPSPSSPSSFNFTRAASDLMSKARKPKLLLLREDKDRFDAMRRIQKQTSSFKKWSTLCFTIVAFGLMWCLGALVFWLCERNVQDMTYFNALYFCYVCLLTIGYGDMAPQSNAGRPFFVVWSLIALPTMAFLVKYLGDTVIGSFKRGVSAIGDFTLLPKQGAYRKLLDHFPRLKQWLQRRKDEKLSQQRLEAGFPVGIDEDAERRAKTLEQFARETPTHYDLARRLAKTIRQVAKDAKSKQDKRYTYVEWLQFGQMIRFTAEKDEGSDGGVDEEGVVEWDWIGENSPLMTRGTEADFVLDRLCESMNRYIHRISNTRNARETFAEAGRAILASGRSKPLPLPVDRARADGSVRKRGNSVRGEARRHFDNAATSDVQEE
jgi:potassium channel subfamily K